MNVKFKLYYVMENAKYYHIILTSVNIFRKLN